MNLVFHIENLRRMKSEADQALAYAVSTQRIAFANATTAYVDALEEAIAAAANANE